MNGRILVSKPLYVALAQRKDERKAHLNQQYMQRVSGLRMQVMQCSDAVSHVGHIQVLMMSRADNFRCK